jgi:tRNA(Ile)-lysidine synthase TilS/MesJ
MIKTSLEWSGYETNLLHKASNLANGRDVKKMIENIQIEITMLSKAEVEARQGRKHHAEELLIKVNQDIEMVEEYLLVAALLG